MKGTIQNALPGAIWKSSEFFVYRHLFQHPADKEFVNIGIVPVTNLVGHTGLAMQYGGKVAGYANLLRVQAKSPVAFEVPPAWAIPPASVHEASDAELRAAFEALTKGIKGPRILMTRSSHLHESPGKYDSPMMTVGRKSSGLSRLVDFVLNRKASDNFERFWDTIRRMQQDPEMGILATLNVAQTLQTLDGYETLGGDLVSFVANTHSPMKPSQLYIAMAQGLGTRVVMAGSDAIPICVERNDRWITFIGNRSAESMRYDQGGYRPALPEKNNYQQSKVDVWEIDSEQLYTLPLAERLLDGANYYMSLQLGRLRPSSTNGNTYRDTIGIAPFDDPVMLENLISVLIYLSEVLGPSQVEGAFPTRTTATPFFYQWIPVPEIRSNPRPLKPFKVHLTSNSVVGQGTFEGPLIYLTTIQPFWGLEKLDRLFANTGYILVTKLHPRDLVADTPHCRCRLSFESENMASHAATVMLHQIAANPEAGMVLANYVEEVEPHLYRKDGKMVLAGIPSRKEDHENGNYYIFNARLDANGEEMVVEILP